MAALPRFSYFISHGKIPVTPASASWSRPLPLDRKFTGETSGFSISCGEYFAAIRAFLESSGLELICRAASDLTNQAVTPDDIHAIRICLEKHGAFYHPARLEVRACDQKISLVLNVAVSDAGLRHIRQEYACLQKLNSEFRLSFLPRVYGLADLTAADNRSLIVFVGEWFENYHEFHLSRDTVDRRLKPAVWNAPDRRIFMSPRLADGLYRQVARILAYYYDVETFVQVLAWHHAAGDFVVRSDQSQIEVKLISVRRYQPFLKSSDKSEQTSASPDIILQALLIFFLNLGVRTRLDRLDGIGDLVWADSAAVGPTLTGFMEGLALKAPLRMLPDSIEHCFRYYLCLCTREDLYELSHAVVDALHPAAPEFPIIKKHLVDHIETLFRAIQQMMA